MNVYELVVILNAATNDEAKEAFLNKLKTLVGSDSELKVEDWGRRKLAYEIKKSREGYYLLVNFETNAENVAEIERKLRIDDSVLKHMIIKK